MNKKIMITTVAIIVVLMLLVPTVSACGDRNRCGHREKRCENRFEKEPITLKFIAVPGSTTGGEQTIIHDVSHWTNRVKVYNLEFSIDGGDLIYGVDNAISSYYWWTMDNGVIIPYADMNPDTSLGFGIYREYNMLTFEGMDGTFVGFSYLKITNYHYTVPPTFHIEASGVFYGTGVFEGQKIVASYEGSQGGTWTGYLIKT